MFYSKIIFYIIISFFVSIWLGEYFVLPIYLVAILPLIFFLPSKYRFIIILVVLITLGNIRYHQHLNQYSFDLVEGKSEFVGVISSESAFKNEKHQFRVETDQGNLLVKASLAGGFSYGDEISFSCEIKKQEVIEEFDYPKYLQLKRVVAACETRELRLLRHGQGSKFYAKILLVKHNLIDRINKILPEPYSSFLAGLLVGGTQGLPQEIIDRFKITGTSHVVAVSGFNVAIIINFILGAFQSLNLSRKKIFWLLTLGLIFFNLITGFQSSILRAVLMGWVMVLSATVGRLVNIRSLLLFVAVTLILINPLVLKHDIGFQLSFLATIGLIFLSPIVSSRLKLDRINNKLIFTLINDLCLPSIVAYIITLPIIVYYFGTLSIVAPLTNILIAPLIPLAMLFGTVSIIGGIAMSLLKPLSLVLTSLAWATLELILKIISYFSHFSFAQVQLEKISPIFVIISYLIIWVLYRLSSRPRAAKN